MDPASRSRLDRRDQCDVCNRRQKDGRTRRRHQPDDQARAPARRARLLDRTGLLESRVRDRGESAYYRFRVRSEEHTSELQSPYDLVCRLLLEKKKKKKIKNN